MTEVAIKTVRALQCAQINILPTVTIDISQCHPGTVMCNCIGQGKISLELIGKEHAGNSRLHQRETRL